MKKTIFKIPTWHPQHEISFEDLQTVVAVYDPALFMAPLKPGHLDAPGTPAFAWFKELSVDRTTQSLSVTLDPALLTEAGYEAIRGGNYKHLSPEFYVPNDPYNPTPGTYYFRGLAYLGAEAPVGKGLDTITAADLVGVALPAAWAEPAVIPFKEEKGKAAAVIFDQEESIHIGGSNVKKKKLLELIQAKAKGIVADDKIAAFSEQVADAVLSDSPEFEELNEVSALHFAERIIAAELKAHKAEGETEKAKADAAKQAATFAEQGRSAAVTAKVAALVTAGRIPPKRKDEFVAFGMGLPSNEETFLAFTEKDGKQGKRSLWDTFCSFAEEFFPAVKANLDEVAKDDGKTASFAEDKDVKEGKKIAESVTPQKK